MSAREQLDVGDFASIVSPSSEGAASWVPAAFPDPSGGSWTFAEPNAVVIVQDGRLRVAAAPYTRQHDSVQILDNAKHMYFSTRTFEAPEQGSMRVDWEMAARVVDAVPGDLYDGFVSFHLLDLGTGTALDIKQVERRLRESMTSIIFRPDPRTRGTAVPSHGRAGLSLSLCHMSNKIVCFLITCNRKSLLCYCTASKTKIHGRAGWPGQACRLVRPADPG